MGPGDLSSQGAGSSHSSHPPVCPGHQVFWVKNDGSFVGETASPALVLGSKGLPEPTHAQPCRDEQPGLCWSGQTGSSHPAQVEGGRSGWRGEGDRRQEAAPCHAPLNASQVKFLSLYSLLMVKGVSRAQAGLAGDHGTS